MSGPDPAGRTALIARFALALGAGGLAGAAYWLLGVPSPAPPWTALCGLLGILLGEAALTGSRDRLRARRGRARTAPHDGSTSTSGRQTSDR